MSSKWHKFKTSSSSGGGGLQYSEERYEEEYEEGSPEEEIEEKVYKTTVMRPKVETVYTKTYPKVEKVYEETVTKPVFEKVYETTVVRPVVEKVYTSSSTGPAGNMFFEKFKEAKINPATTILPNVNEFYISFKNSDDEEENESDDMENSKRVKIDKDSMYKIFKMAKIPKSHIGTYILFSFMLLQNDVSTKNKNNQKINYKKLLKLIENFYVSFPNDDDDDEEENDIELNKQSLNKIFDLIDLPINDRLNLLQFYEVEEEENEEDDSPKKPKKKKL